MQCLQSTWSTLEKTTSAKEDRLFFHKVLSFCIDPNAYTDSFLLPNSPDHEKETCSYFLLLWEIRVLCGHYLPQQRLRQQLHFLWTTKLSSRVRVVMSAMGTMKTAVGDTLVSCAETVAQKYHCSRILSPVSRQTRRFHWRLDGRPENPLRAG
jgi:hypothetical protein